MNNDLDLFQRWKKGDETAFDEIFQRHYNDLCHSSYHIIQDRAAAEDVVQEFFISFWNSRSALVIKSNLKAYLKRAVINRSINHLKSVKSKHQSTSLDHVTNNISVSPDETLERADQHEAIKRCVDKLPEKRRMAFILNRFEELSYKEISSIMEISVKTVEVHLRNARIALRECLRYLVQENHTFG